MPQDNKDDIQKLRRKRNTLYIKAEIVRKDILEINKKLKALQK